MSWIPATTPTWVISCWVAPATPRSSSSTALATVAAIDGADAPSPIPESASESTTQWSPAPGVTWARPTIDTVTALAPKMPADRSPTRSAT